MKIPYAILTAAWLFGVGWACLEIGTRRKPSWRTAFLIVLWPLAGCASNQINVNLDNRVVCTVAGDKAYVVSDSAPAGISLAIADLDRAAICRK